jgi:hypothetical protein
MNNYNFNIDNKEIKIDVLLRKYNSEGLFDVSIIHQLQVKYKLYKNYLMLATDNGFYKL